MGQSHLCVTWSWSSVSLSFSERQGNSRKYTPPPSVPMQSRSHDLSKRRTVTRVALRRRRRGVRMRRMKPSFILTAMIIFHNKTGRDVIANGDKLNRLVRPAWSAIWQNFEMINHKVLQWPESLRRVVGLITNSGKIDCLYNCPYNYWEWWTTANYESVQTHFKGYSRINDSPYLQLSMPGLPGSV